MLKCHGFFLFRKLVSRWKKNSSAQHGKYDVLERSEPWMVPPCSSMLFSSLTNSFHGSPTAATHRAQWELVSYAWTSSATNRSCTFSDVAAIISKISSSPRSKLGCAPGSTKHGSLSLWTMYCIKTSSSVNSSHLLLPGSRKTASAFWWTIPAQCSVSNSNSVRRSHHFDNPP